MALEAHPSIAQELRNSASRLAGELAEGAPFLNTKSPPFARLTEGWVRLKKALLSCILNWKNSNTDQERKK